MAMLGARFGRPAAAGRTWCIGSHLRCDDSSGGRAHVPCIDGRYRQGRGQPQAHQLVELCSRGPPELVEAPRVPGGGGAWGPCRSQMPTSYSLANRAPGRAASARVVLEIR